MRKCYFPIAFLSDDTFCLQQLSHVGMGCDFLINGKGISIISARVIFTIFILYREYYNNIFLISGNFYKYLLFHFLTCVACIQEI